MQAIQTKAIQTKYIGPTNFLGSRVKAVAQSGAVTVKWDCALDQEENHRQAALALCRRLGWRWSQACMATGWLNDGSAVHVYIPQEEK